MPDKRLKRFRVRGYARGINDWNKDTSVSNLCGVSAVTTDDATDRGTNLLRVFQRAHQVGAYILSRISPSN